MELYRAHSITMGSCPVRNRVPRHRRNLFPQARSHQRTGKSSRACRHLSSSKRSAISIPPRTRVPPRCASRINACAFNSHASSDFHQTLPTPISPSSVSKALAWNEQEISATLTRAERAITSAKVSDADTLQLVQQMFDYTSRLELRRTRTEEKPPA